MRETCEPLFKAPSNSAALPANTKIKVSIRKIFCWGGCCIVRDSDEGEIVGWVERECYPTSTNDMMSGRLPVIRSRDTAREKLSVCPKNL